MKPLVYFNDFKPYDNNHVIVENNRLQEIFNEIYNAGFEDGKGGSYYYSTPKVYPNMVLGKEVLDDNFRLKPLGSIYGATSIDDSNVGKFK